YFNIVLGDEKVGQKLKEIRLPFGTGLAGWCAKESQPVIVPDASKDPRFFKTADKSSGFVTRSMICVPMRLKDEVIGVIQVLNRTGDIPFNDHDVEILEAVANQAVSALDNARLYENIQRVYLSTVEVLATAIDAKDPYTHGHSRRVTDYSVAIAEEMGLSKAEIDNVRYAGLLHDVGKIGIKDSIIGKPERLTDEEYNIIKRHPSIGADILKPVEFLSDKIPGVLHHHEYYDGRGYPDHLKGEDIPFIGRVICVADAFDAMTSDRPYRKGLNVNVAIGELKKFSGKQFDPACVDAFLRAFEKKIFQWFEKVPGSDELVLKPDPVGSVRFPEVPAPHGDTGHKESTQPFPPIHPDEKKGTPSSQPFPPIHPEAASKPSSQPFPPIHPEEKKSTPSSQPFPPIHPGEPPKDDKK
ncbi:MAG TPA: HD domain-containing protein, partial [Candidatus Ozemobacteraceae bacterium]|nr:HD domain-containing protein [Candidatus Ozemobacteraceae bacterium]